MRIGQAARALGISRDTLLRFESRGVIAPQRDWAGHRRYTEEDLARLRAIHTPSVYLHTGPFTEKDLAWLRSSQSPTLEDLAEDPAKAASLAPEVRQALTLRCVAVLVALTSTQDRVDEPPETA